MTDSSAWSARPDTRGSSGDDADGSGRAAVLTLVPDPPAVADRAAGPTGAEVAAAVTALRDCEQAATVSAATMAARPGLAAEVRLAMDCADVCAAASRVLSRGPGADAEGVDALVTAAAAGADACVRAHGGAADRDPLRREHVASARACLDALRALALATTP